jgi:hypothetical protein
MSGRVLNFFEFSDKYSTGNSDSSGIDDISNAAANFEEGFDDSTYDQPQLGPKRPVSGNYEATPAGPGEGGVPAYSPGAKAGMAAPEEDEMEEDEEIEDDGDDEIEEEDDDSGNPEGEEEEEDESEEKVEESFRLVKSFSRFVNESYDDYDGEEYSDEYSEDTGDLEAYLGDDYAEEEGDWDDEEEVGYYGANPDDYFGYGMQPEDVDQSTVDAGMYPEEYNDDEEEGDEVFCSSCGAAGDEYGYSCGCNM